MEATQISLGGFGEDVTAKELTEFLEDSVGLLWRCRLKTSWTPPYAFPNFTNHNGIGDSLVQNKAKVPPHAFVHFAAPDAVEKATKLAERRRLIFNTHALKVKVGTETSSRTLKRRTVQPLRFSDVRVEIGSMYSLDQFWVAWQAPTCGVDFYVDPFDRRCRILLTRDQVFTLGDGWDRDRDTVIKCDFKIEFLVRDIRNVRFLNEMGTLVMLLQLWVPPRIYYRTADDDIYVGVPFALLDDDDPWIRTLDFTPNNVLGRCLVYKISLSPRMGHTMEKAKLYFKQHRLVDDKFHRLRTLNEPAVVAEGFFFVLPPNGEIRFDTMYLLNALVHKGVVSYHRLTPEFYDILNPSVTPTELSTVALRHILAYINPIYDAFTSRYLHIGADGDTDCQFVEMDPTGRYGRYNEVLGKGAFKTVYKAFDEINGMEVAWNQIKVQDVLRTPEDLQRIYSEVHLLKTLKHKSIIKLYTSWVDEKTQKINFITEMFTSGTLREYRQKHKRVDIIAIKNWACQILQGLLYLHSHDPPIIHRDLKCDNIFVNGNQGEVKIGDLGLAAILRQSHAAHSVIGTPEFMAPELYEEEYNELVDIYAFGMCLLEMLTFEYPYSECTNPAQIYKKVTSGIKPEALYKIKDPEMRQFVEKCLETASRRLPAKDLLNDPFLQFDDYDLEHVLLRTCSVNECDPKDTRNGVIMGHIEHRNLQVVDPSCGNIVVNENEEYAWEPHKIEHFPNFLESNSSKNRDFTIKGKKREDDTIFLRVRIADKEGRVRNIYFPFDVESDTAMGVASEMVAELDITDQDVMEIADTIDEEISALVPDWKGAVALEDGEGGEECSSCDHFFSQSMGNGFHLSTTSSESSLLNYLTSHNLVGMGSGPSPSTRVADAVHGRFKEITYQVNGSDASFFVAEEAHAVSTESSDIHQDADDWSIGEDYSLPSSPISNKSEAGKFLHTSRFSKSTEPTVQADLSDHPCERLEQICPDGSFSEYCGFQSYGLPEGFDISPHHEQDCFRPAYKSQCFQSVPSFDCFSDEDENLVSRELRLLAAINEHEFKELKRKQDLSLLEIKNRLSNENAVRHSPNGPMTSPRPNVTYVSQNSKMGMNGRQELVEDHWKRYSRQLKQELQEDMVSIKQGTAAAINNRTSCNYSPKPSKNSMITLDKLPISSPATVPSLSHRPANQKTTAKRRMTKIHSFGDLSGSRYLRSLAAEVSRLRLYQTVGVVSTEKVKSNRDFPNSMKLAPSVPRTHLRDYYGQRPQ